MSAKEIYYKGILKNKVSSHMFNKEKIETNKKLSEFFFKITTVDWYIISPNILIGIGK